MKRSWSRSATCYRAWLKGEEFKAEVAEFGEGIWYMKADTVGTNKADARWEEGIWLGIQEVSGEHIIGTEEGCLKTKDIRRKPQEDWWKIENMRKMKGTPWEPIPGHPDRALKSRVIMHEEPILPPPQAEERQESMRRLYIRRRDVQKH